MGRLKDCVAIVTGAGQGIGRAIALGVGGEGASVVIAEKDLDNALNVQREVERAGRQGLAVQTDVCREDSIKAMVRRSLDEYGRVDILVNNAGIYPVSSVENMSEDEWDHVIRTNLVGAFLCAREVVPTFLEQGKGRIINITSGTAFRGAKNGAHYAASKAGIIGFTKALALELAPYGITVNSICPGLTDTAQPRGHSTEEELYAKAKRIPLGRIGRPEDLIGPAIFLASDGARYVTGQTLLVNGGDVMW